MSYETGTATSAVDLLAKLNTFLLKGHTLSPAYAGTGTGLITGLIGSSTSVLETITVTFTSATAFGVVGSVTGSMGTGTTGTLFTHAKVSFTITVGGTAWVSGDTIIFVMTPPWISKRYQTDVSRLALLGDFTNPTYPASQAFDGTYTTLASTNAALPHQLGQQFSAAVTLTRFIITGGQTPGETPKDFTIEYSDNGTAWTNSGTYTNQTAWGVGEARTFTVTGGSGAHAYWRVNVSTNNGGAYTSFGELAFYDGATASDLLPRPTEAIWQAPGNSNADQILVGARYFSDIVGYYNLQLGGFTAYSAGVDFGLQPGSIVNSATLHSPCIPLSNASMTYWFMANGRRVIIIAKAGTNYESAYLGFIENYPSPGQWSYPLAVGGSMAFNSEPASNSALWAYSNAANAHSAFWRGIPETTNTLTQLRLRKPDGVWQGFSSTAYNGTQGTIWPYANSMTDLRANLDGTYPLLPIILSDYAPNMYGRLDGIWAVTGYLQTPENTITIGRDTWLVIQNVIRNTKIDFAAVRMD
jgi:hypothetical protein